MMKTVIIDKYGPAESMLVQETPLPDPVKNEVLIKLHYAGVNPVDTYHRSGTNGYTPSLPFTPGLDGAGEIAATGKDVKSYKIGDRVYCTPLRIIGTYGEYCLVVENEVRPLPETLSYAEGAGLYVPYYTAYSAMILRGKAEKGETILIHGASGAVGQACLQIARSMNMKVIATAGSKQGLKLLQDLGADIVLNHNEANHMEMINDLLKGETISLIIEFMANKNLQEDMEFCGKNGRIIIVGNRGEITINPRLTMKNNLDIRGLSLFNMTQKELDMIHEALYRGAQEGWLKPGINRIFNLDEVAQAHNQITKGPSLGRILLKTGK